MTFKTITSVHNPRVKQAIHLRASRPRAKQQRILIDGARELLQALRGNVQLVELFLCDPLCKSPAALQVLARLDSLEVDAWHVPPAIYEKLAFGERCDGVLAVAETPRRDLADLTPAEPGLVAVLEGLEKPGNVGAVLRSADGAGASAVIVADPRTDLFNPNCIRASLGTVFTRPVCTASAADALAWLRGRGLKIYAARPDAEIPYTQADLATNAAVVVGNEAAGLSDLWHAADVIAIKLPMHGAVDSLNVSATCAVLFYEALRQSESARS